MIAIKYRPDYLELDTPFQWPSKLRLNVTSLPEGYDELITQAQLDTLVSDNQASYNTQKAAQLLATQTQQGLQAFSLVRKKWQEISDRYAFENVSSGITTAVAVQIANSFSTVKYLLDTNVPMGAISAIDSVPPIDPFLTIEKRDAMKAELQAYVIEVFNIGA